MSNTSRLFVGQSDEMSQDSTPGGCFREALRAANISIPNDLFIPDWIKRDNIPAICKNLNLEWIGGGKIHIGVEPVIVLYRTGEDKGHAVFVPDIGPLLDFNIVGLIRLPEARGVLESLVSKSVPSPIRCSICPSPKSAYHTPTIQRGPTV